MPRPVISLLSKEAIVVGIVAVVMVVAVVVVALVQVTWHESTSVVTE